MKIVCLLLILTFQIAWAEDAKVIYSIGQNTITNNSGEQKSINKGDILIEGETLTTGDKSFVILKIGTHSTHRVEENTQIEIAKLPYMYQDTSELEQGGSFILKVGTIFSEILKKSDNESFEIKTQNTTMGVRGTKFMASVDSDSEDTWVTVNEGVVEVNNSASNSSDIIEKDRSMIIEKDKGFTRQQKYEWQKNLKWNIADNKNDFKSFKSQRKKALKEFRQKRSQWVRNEERWSRFQNERGEKLAKFRDRVKNFRSSDKFKKRKEKIKELKAKRDEFKSKRKQKVKDLQNKRQLFNEGLKNKKKKQNRVNDFIKNERFKDRSGERQDRLNRLRNLRKKLRRPKPNNGDLPGL